MQDNQTNEQAQANVAAAAMEARAEQERKAREELERRLRTPISDEEAAVAYAQIGFRTAQLRLVKANLIAELDRVDAELAVAECERAEIQMRQTVKKDAEASE